MELPKWARSIIGWVRAGYPEGVPQTDYVPLFAVLGSQLSEEECQGIADELALTDDADSLAAIRKVISHTTNELPKECEISAVRARLAAGGWPLAPLDRQEELFSRTPRGTCSPARRARPAAQPEPLSPSRSASPIAQASAL